MQILDEHFAEKAKDTFYYELKVLNPATSSTWEVKAVIKVDGDYMNIIESQMTHLKKESAPTMDAMLALDEKCNLRNLVYEMVYQLRKGKREPYTS